MSDTVIILGFLTPFLLLPLILAAVRIHDGLERRRIVREFHRRRAARSPEEVQAEVDETMERCMPGFMAAWRRRDVEGDQNR